MAFGNYCRRRDRGDCDGAARLSARAAASLDGYEPRRTPAEDLFVHPSSVPDAVVLDDTYRIYGGDTRPLYEPLGGDRSFGDRDTVRVHDRLRRRAGEGQGVRRTE